MATSGSVQSTAVPLRARWQQWIVPVFSLTLIGTALTLALTRWDRWVSYAEFQTTDDAMVRADTTALSSRVAGNVVAVPVQDFESVGSRQLLLQIDKRDHQVALAQAEASVAAASASLSNLDSQAALQRATIMQAEAQVSSARAKGRQAVQELERQHELQRSTFATRQRVEQAEAEAASAQANEQAAEAALLAQREQLNVLSGIRRERQAKLEAARADRAAAELRLGYTEVIAPFDGVVGQRQVQRGEYVTVGSTLISVVPLSGVYVIANYKETQLTRVRVDQPVRVTVDAFPSESFSGRVQRISPASGSQFALLPPDNATGNFTKIVQRIPVRITFDPDQPLLRELRAGMSVVTHIDTRSGDK